MSLSRRDFSCSLAAGGLALGGCRGLADHYSWLQDYSKRKDGLPQRCLPFDEQLRPKPLRAAIAGALRAMPAR